MKDSNKAEEWQQLIADYRSSGFSAKAWCELNEKKIHTLRYWITHFNKLQKQSNEGQDQQWLSLPLKEHDTQHSPIILKTDIITIEISAGFNKNVLMDVLSAVQSYDRCNRL